jgi:hypothetical protein
MFSYPIFPTLYDHKEYLLSLTSKQDTPKLFGIVNDEAAFSSGQFKKVVIAALIVPP